MNDGIKFELYSTTKKYVTLEGEPFHELAARAYDEYGIGEPYIILEHSKSTDNR